MHGGVRAADLDGQSPRAPSPSADAAHRSAAPRFVHPSRRAVRPAGGLLKTRQRCSSLRAGKAPAAHLLTDVDFVSPSSRTRPTTTSRPHAVLRSLGVRHLRTSLRDASSHPHRLARPGPITRHSERPWARQLAPSQLSLNLSPEAAVVLQRDRADGGLCAVSGRNQRHNHFLATASEGRPVWGSANGGIPSAR